MASVNTLIQHYYSGQDNDTEDPLLEWIEEQRTSDTIEEVTEEILQLLTSSGMKEYVAVFFTGPCNENAPTADQECERVLPSRPG